MRGGSESKRCLKGARHWGGDFSRVAFRDSRRASVRVVLPGYMKKSGKHIVRKQQNFRVQTFCLFVCFYHIGSYECVCDITFCLVKNIVFEWILFN